MSQTIKNLAAVENDRLVEGFAIAPGIVKNNFDLIAEGRVQVRIPSVPGFSPWARLASVGGGSDRGFLWVPQMNDEVLVAFAQNDLGSAYIVGGLWSTKARPPILAPTDALQKRILKTGVAGGPSHEIEFDDVLQSITITTSTKQKITLNPLAISISNLAGTVKIELDNKTQTISIQAAKKIDLKAAQIALTGASVEIKTGNLNISSTGPCTVTGLPIKLN